MIPGMNPRMMRQAMKKMGISQEEIPANEVIIKTNDKEIVITSPSVLKVNMSGQESFQISGEIHVREKTSSIEISKDDIMTVVEQANVSEKKAKAALETAKGDIAEAILLLQS